MIVCSPTSLATCASVSAEMGKPIAVTAAAALAGSVPNTAAGAFIGHLYPVWLRFDGGKGIATLAGIMFGLFWQGGLVYAVIWLGVLAILRISSLAGLLAAASAPIAALLFGREWLVPLLLAFLVLTLWKHRPNVIRLLQGQEPKVGKS